MRIKYIDYQEDIFAEAIDSCEPRIYVFDNFENLKEARKYYEQPFLQKESHFLTMMDFKEKLFPNDKLIVKEEKLAILFYELLTDDEKGKLEIDDYFDSIDLSAKFFNFYRELHEYKVDKLDDLRDWQQEKYEIMESIRKRYLKKLGEINYIDSTLVFDFQYFNDYYLSKYREIVFINKIDFTPWEKDLLNRIEESGYYVQLYLQLDKRDYDISNLQINSFSLPGNPVTEIELYHTEEDLLQIVNLISHLNLDSELKRGMYKENIDLAQSMSLICPNSVKDKAYNGIKNHTIDQLDNRCIADVNNKTDKRNAADKSYKAKTANDNRSQDNSDDNKIADICILDANFTNSSYQNLLSSEMIQVDKEISFTKTQLYKYLDALYNIVSSADSAMGDLKLEISSLLEACYWPKFREYFNLNKIDLKNLQLLAAEDYIYLTTGLIEAKGDILSKFEVIIEEIREINNLENLYEYTTFLEHIDLRKLDDDKFSNNIAQYYDALLEIHSIEEMNIVSSWNKYFSNKAQGLFRLVLNYLRYKQVTLLTNQDIKGNESQRLHIKELLTATHLNQDNLIILNASRGIIPSEDSGAFLLSEKQRAELGLKTSTRARLEEKYYFFRHLFSSKKAIVFSVKNLEENITTSSFVDELMLKYGLEVKEMEIKTKDYSSVSKSIFNNDRTAINSYVYPDTTIDDKLMIEKEDFKENFSLAYYKYGVLKDCYYKFYLEHIAHLEEDHIEIEKELGPRVLGILVHEIFGEIIDQIGSSFKADEELIKVVVMAKFKSYYLKVNSFYKKYYRDILFPRIERSIVYFFQEIKRRIDGSIQGVLTEWKPEAGKEKSFYKNELTSIYLNGRVDLLINTDSRKYLIDFKTGSGDIKQLDFYSLLINPNQSGDYVFDKAIYAVLDEKFDTGKTGTETQLAEEIIETLTDFLNEEYYSYKYKSFCQKCIMTDICRVV